MGSDAKSGLMALSALIVGICIGAGIIYMVGDWPAFVHSLSR